jgi:hypothetical protein
LKLPVEVFEVVRGLGWPRTWTRVRGCRLYVKLELESERDDGRYTIRLYETTGIQLQRSRPKKKIVAEGRRTAA